MMMGPLTQRLAVSDLGLPIALALLYATRRHVFISFKAGKKMKKGRKDGRRSITLYELPRFIKWGPLPFL